MHNRQIHPHYYLFEIHSFDIVSVECAKKKCRNSWPKCSTVKYINSIAVYSMKCWACGLRVCFVTSLNKIQRKQTYSLAKTEWKFHQINKEYINIRNVFLHAYHTIRIRVCVWMWAKEGRNWLCLCSHQMYCVYLVWQKQISKDIPHERRDIADGYLVYIFCWKYIKYIFFLLLPFGKMLAEMSHRKYN